MAIFRHIYPPHPDNLQLKLSVKVIYSYPPHPIVQVYNRNLQFKFTINSLQWKVYSQSLHKKNLHKSAAKWEEEL